MKKIKEKRMGLGYSAYTHVSKKTNWNKKIRKILKDEASEHDSCGYDIDCIINSETLTNDFLTLLHEYGEWLRKGYTVTYDDETEAVVKEVVDGIRQQQRKLNKEIL